MPSTSICVFGARGCELEVPAASKSNEIVLNV